jgi:xanthine/uracil/vitamin C permease (AzgA family)
MLIYTKPVHAYMPHAHVAHAQGVLYFFMTITGLRFLLFKAVPIDLRHAISAGIGLFICIIGYKVRSPVYACI